MASLARRCPRNDSVRSGRQLTIRVSAQNGDAMTVTVTDRTLRVTWLAAQRKLAYRGVNLASAGCVAICRPGAQRTALRASGSLGSLAAYRLVSYNIAKSHLEIEDVFCCGICQMLHCCALSALWYLLQASTLSTAPCGDPNKNRQVLIQSHRPFVSSLLSMMSAKTPFQVVSLSPEVDFANAVNV